MGLSGFASTGVTSVLVVSADADAAVADADAADVCMYVYICLQSNSSAWRVIRLSRRGRGRRSGPRIRSIQHCALAARLPEPGRPRWLRYCDANDAGGMEDGAMAEPYSIYNLVRRRYLVWNRVSLSPV